MIYRIPRHAKTVLWLPLALLSLASLGCRDDLLTTEPLVREDPGISPAPSTFAYQLLGDPWIGLVAEGSGYRDVSFELDQVLYALSPNQGTDPSPSLSALRLTRQSLHPLASSGQMNELAESDVISAILDLTVNRVTTILEHAESVSPNIWPASAVTQPSAER